MRFQVLLPLLAVLIFGSSLAHAFPSNIQILEKKDIVRLSDAALTEAYLDTAIELEAKTLRHTTTGFAPREYQEYKALLRYRYELNAELQKRSLPVPVIKSGN